MVPHSLPDHIRVTTLEKPVTGLCVPDKGVSVGGLAVFGSPSHQGVGLLNPPFVLSWMHSLRLHAVFRCHCIEVFRSSCQFCFGITRREIASSSDAKRFAKGISDAAIDADFREGLAGNCWLWISW